MNSMLPVCQFFPNQTMQSQTRSQLNQLILKFIKCKGSKIAQTSCTSDRRSHWPSADMHRGGQGGPWGERRLRQTRHLCPRSLVNDDAGQLDLDMKMMKLCLKPSQHAQKSVPGRQNNKVFWKVTQQNKQRKTSKN